jgi:hypothetical protein
MLAKLVFQIGLDRVRVACPAAVGPERGTAR